METILDVVKRVCLQIWKTINIRKHKKTDKEEQILPPSAFSIPVMCTAPQYVYVTAEPVVTFYTSSSTSQDTDTLEIHGMGNVNEIKFPIYDECSYSYMAPNIVAWNLKDTMEGHTFTINGKTITRRNSEKNI